MTQQDLAAQANVSSSTLRAIEADRDDSRSVYKTTALGLLRVLYEAEPLTPGEVERFRDAFELAARDVAATIEPLRRAAGATGHGDIAARIRSDIGRIASYLGEEVTAELVRNWAQILTIAANQADADASRDLAAQLVGFRLREGMARTESEPDPTSNPPSDPASQHPSAADDRASPRRTRRITVRQPPIPGESAGLPPGSTVERFEHYTMDEATGELRRLSDLAGRKDVDPALLREALLSVAKRLPTGSE